MLVSFILGVAYGGNLRAFLANPPIPKSLNSIADLVQSGLPWTMSLYGELIEAELSTSKDPIMRTFWNNKVVVPNKRFAYNMVRPIRQCKITYICTSVS